MAGIYRRSVLLASGRYALIDDGIGFSLVPWRTVIEQRLGQKIDYQRSRSEERTYEGRKPPGTAPALLRHVLPRASMVW